MVRKGYILKGILSFFRKSVILPRGESKSEKFYRFQNANAITLSPPKHRIDAKRTFSWLTPYTQRLEKVAGKFLGELSIQQRGWSPDGLLPESCWLVRRRQRGYGTVFGWIETNWFHHPSSWTWTYLLFPSLCTATTWIQVCLLFWVSLVTSPRRGWVWERLRIFSDFWWFFGMTVIFDAEAWLNPINIGMFWRFLITYQQNYETVHFRWLWALHVGLWWLRWIPGYWWGVGASGGGFINFLFFNFSIFAYLMAILCPPITIGFTRLSTKTTGTSIRITKISVDVFMNFLT